MRDRSPAKIGLDYCDKLFRLENDYAEGKLSSQERYQALLKQSKSVAEKFFDRAKTEYGKNPALKSMFGTALTYAMNQEKWLMNAFLDGQLELSNNRVQWAVRPFAVGRKNWLFANTPKGANASVAIYATVETAKAAVCGLSRTSSSVWKTCPAASPPKPVCPGTILCNRCANNRLPLKTAVAGYLCSV